MVQVNIIGTIEIYSDTKENADFIIKYMQRSFSCRQAEFIVYFKDGIKEESPVTAMDKFQLIFESPFLGEKE